MYKHSCKKYSFVVKLQYNGKWRYHMIRNNLSILMSERGVKNSTLSLKTGISKNTISSTAQNDGKMIQLETVNKICQVLDVSPSEFFSYLPFDIRISSSLNGLDINGEKNEKNRINKIVASKLDIDLFIQVSEKNNITKTYEFECRQETEWELNDPFISAKVIISDSSDSEFVSFWNSISTPFQTDIKKEIQSDLELTIIDFMNEKVKKLCEHYPLDSGKPEEMLDYFSLDLRSAQLSL